MRTIKALAILLSLASTGFADLHTFTDSKGRTISAEVMTVFGENVTIKRKDGRIFTLPANSLSEADQTYIEEWLAKNAAENAQLKAAAEVALKLEQITAFCLAKKDQKVGNGECWTLADHAYTATKAKRPDGQSRIWGRIVDLEKEKTQPGDVIEFKNAKISGYGTTGPAHTAVVVVKRGNSQRCTIAEQNWNNIKKVRFIEIDLRNLESGEITVYRLEK